MSNRTNCDPLITSLYNLQPKNFCLLNAHSLSPHIAGCLHHAAPAQVLAL